MSNENAELDESNALRRLLMSCFDDSVDIDWPGSNDYKVGKKPFVRPSINTLRSRELIGRKSSNRYQNTFFYIAQVLAPLSMMTDGKDPEKEALSLAGVIQTKFTAWTYTPVIASGYVSNGITIEESGIYDRGRTSMPEFTSKIYFVNFRAKCKHVFFE